MDSALTQNASRALADAAATIERTFGVKPTDSVLFPELIGHVLLNGGYISTLAGTATAINIRASGRTIS